MTNLFDRYGIKEVADVTFYDINENDPSTPGAPVLYLDTLKFSTIEQTAENAEARGGKGNAALISWDFGKEITVTLEDALYSPKSLALIYGDEDATPDTYTGTVTKTVWRKTATFEGSYAAAEKGKGTLAVMINGGKVSMTEVTFYDENGGVVTSGTDWNYATGKVAVKNGLSIDVSANGFPGTYYVTGDTYARNEATGKDEFFQFVIPKAKVMPESNTITMEADGDPTVFSMNLKVLRPRDGVMMKLVQYNV
jgi:hypothetical protein